MEYTGHPLQIRGAERVIMQGGRAEGMHFVIVRNGLGLECWISLDRGADLMRVTYKGNNMGFLSPCGNVSPQYYDKEGAGFLKSFTAGFFTTAGLAAVGSPCVDDGEVLPLHGTVAHIPADCCDVLENEKGITVKATVRDCVIFGRKLVLRRSYILSFLENTLTVRDSVTNEGDADSPFMILYHCNMGYPLLSENSKVVIPNSGVTPRNEHSAEHQSAALTMEKPQAGYKEVCYYYDVTAKDSVARVGIFNPDISAGAVFCYDKRELPFFTEWKMMGKYDYALGLEPGNCTPDGRDVMRKNGTLKILSPDQTAETGVTFKFTDSEEEFNKSF